MATPITEQEFRDIKSALRHDHVVEVARRFNRHLAIVTKISTCPNYERYRAIVKAEHPPVRNSLGDRVSDLEERVTRLEQNPTGGADTLPGYAFTNSAGITYWLHTKIVTLRGDTIYYFAKNVCLEDLAPCLPDGYEVRENTRNRFPTLRRKQS